MSSIRLSSAVVCLFLTACLSDADDGAVPDAGTLPTDAAASPDATDAASMPPDAAAPELDAITFPDAAVLPPDAAALPPDAGPALEGCSGTFLVNTWVVDHAAFDTQFINPLLAGDLAAGELIAFWVLDGRTATFIDALPDGNGDVVPDPDTLPATPITVGFNADGSFQTVQPGSLSFHLSAPDYPNAQPIDLTLLLADLSGTFDPDCQALHGVLHGAFAQNAAFTLPQPPDADTDGDGVNDGYMLDMHFDAPLF